MIHSDKQIKNAKLSAAYDYILQKMPKRSVLGRRETWLDIRKVQATDDENKPLREPSIELSKNPALQAQP